MAGETDWLDVKIQLLGAAVCAERIEALGKCGQYRAQKQIQFSLNVHIEQAFKEMGLGIDIFPDPVPCPKCAGLARPGIVKAHGMCKACLEKR